MHRKIRLRQYASVIAMTGVALALASCTEYGRDYPNSTFNHTTEFNAAIDSLWDKLLFWGTLVFVIVESILLYTIIRFRRRPDDAEPKHVHGNTVLEIAWTLAPAVILVLIAVPTVRTIFRTQARAVANALQVEVIGHQWWWEFRYPQYTTRLPNGRIDTLTTANDLYLPAGRTVNFALKTADVLHSFWVPQLGGKRDLVANHTNYLWFTPDSSLNSNVYNGFCGEYCGASHANMKFRTFVVAPAEFERWTAHQQSPAAFAAAPVPPPAGAPAAGTPPGGTPAAPVPGAAVTPAAGTPAAVAASQALAVSQPADSGFIFPRNQLPAHAVPTRPIPDGLTFPENLTGDPQRGMQLYSRSACIGCHVIRGNPMSVGVIGPSLTHFGSRSTIGAGMFPNDARHLALWIKNTRAMKPGAAMPTLGLGQRDPITGAVVSVGGLNDQQIADIVAYLLALR